MPVDFDSIDAAVDASMAQTSEQPDVFQQADAAVEESKRPVAERRGYIPDMVERAGLAFNVAKENVSSNTMLFGYALKNMDVSKEEAMEFVRKSKSPDTEAQEQRYQALEDNRAIFDAAGLIVNETTKQLPIMGKILPEAGAVSVLGGLVGGGATLAITKSPQAAVKAARWLGGAGWNMGVLQAATQLEGGEIYRTAIESGVSPKAATIAAVAGGGASGLIEVFSIKMLPRQVREAYARQLLARSGGFYEQFQNVMRTYVSGLPKEILTQVSQEEIQEVLISGTTYKILAGFADNPKDQAKLDEAARKQFTSWGETAINTTASTIGFSTSARLIGGTAGGLKNSLFSKEDFDILKEVRLQDALAQHGIRALLGKNLTLKQKLDGIAQFFKLTVGEVRASREGLDKLTDEDVETFAKMSNEEALDFLTSTDKQVELNEKVDSLVLYLKDLRSGEQTPGIEQRVKEVEEEITRQKQILSDLETAKKEFTELMQADKVLLARAEVNVEGEAVEPKDIELIQLENLDDVLVKQDPLVLQGRIDKITDDIKNIDTQLGLLEKQMVEKASRGEGVQTFVKKIDKKYRERSELDSELFGLKNGLFDVGSQSKITTSAWKVLKIKADAVIQSIKAYARGEKQGRKDTRAELDQVRQTLDAFVDSAGLSEEETNAFHARTRKIKDAKSLAKRLPSLQRMLQQTLEKEQMSAATKRLKEALKKGKLKSGGKIPTGNMTAEAQAVVSAVENIMGGTKTIAQFVEPLMKRHADGAILTLQEHAELYIGSLLGFVDIETHSGLNQLADLVEKVVTEGKADHLKKQAAYEKELTFMKGYAVEATQGVNPADIMQGESTVQKNVVRWKHAIISAFNTGMGIWDGIIHSITVDSSQAVANNVKDFFSTRNASKAERRLLVDLHHLLETDLMEAVGGDKHALNTYLRSASQIRDFGAYTDTKGKPHDLITSRLHLITRYLQNMDPERVSNLLNGNNLGKDFFTKIDGILDDKDKAFAEALTKHYKRVYLVANKFYEETYGVSLPYNEFYHPSRVEGFEKDFDLRPGLEDYEFQTIIPGAAHTRTQNKLALQATNAYATAMAHSQAWVHYATWYDAVRKNASLLNDVYFQRAVRFKFGDDVLKTLKEHNESFNKGRGEINNAFARKVNAIRGAMFTAVLGWKPMQIPVQIASAFMAIGKHRIGDKTFEVGISDVLDSFNDLVILKDPYKILANTDFIRARGMQFEPAIKDMNTAEWNPVDWFVERGVPEKMRKYMPTHQEVLTFTMMPTLIGDRGGIYGGGWAVYQKALKATGSHEQAIAYFEDWANDTQQSTDNDRLSVLQRGNVFVKMLSDFSNAPQQAARWAFDAWIDMARPGKKSFGDLKLFTDRLLSGFLVSAVIWGLKQGTVLLDDDEDNDWQAPIDALFAGILSLATSYPFFGDILEVGLGYAYSVAMDKKKPFEPRNATVSLLMDMASVVGDVQKAVESGEPKHWDKFIEHSLTGTSLFLRGIPLNNMYTSLVGLFDSIYHRDEVPLSASFARMAGQPKSMVKFLEEENPEFNPERPPDEEVEEDPTASKGYQDDLNRLNEEEAAVLKDLEEFKKETGANKQPDEVVE